MEDSEIVGPPDFTIIYTSEMRLAYATFALAFVGAVMVLPSPVAEPIVQVG
jgi:hypothetical protein